MCWRAMRPVSNDHGIRKREAAFWQNHMMGVLDRPGSWSVEWSRSPVAGKRVTLVNVTTGQRATGHDWSDWDLALQRALEEVQRQGDLVTEVESYLRGA